jgi:hypothetical protein
MCESMSEQLCYGEIQTAAGPCGTAREAFDTAAADG